MDDLSRGTLNVQDRAGDQIATGGDEEKRFADAGQPFRSADRAVVVEFQPSRNRAAKRQVASEPFPATAILDPDTHVSTNVVFAVAGHEDTMNSAFFAQIAHLKPPRALR